MRMTIERKDCPLVTPFQITGYVFESTAAVWVTLEANGCVGRGEAEGVYYQGETQDSMVAQLEAVRDQVEAGISHKDLANLLPAGGARNALDCALWDLRAKQTQQSIWSLLKLEPKEVTTVATVGVAEPEDMAAQAKQLGAYSKLKIKLSGDRPIERLAAVREARPDAEMIVDVNQGWTFEDLKAFMPDLEKLRIDMVEQPLPRGADEELEGYRSPIPLGADESCLDLNDYPAAAKRYDVINIKLDKCGGLSQGLALVERCQADGKGLMVGNMTGTSLAMAPAYIIAQYCDFVDIDGPLFLKEDIDDALVYSAGGRVSIPEKQLWG